MLLELLERTTSYNRFFSLTDMLYRQTLSVSHGSYLDIEIIDISSTSEVRFPLLSIFTSSHYYFRLHAT